MTKPSLRVQLPEELWLKKDDVQFAWLDAQAGGKLDGYTWHHTETEWQPDSGGIAVSPWGAMGGNVGH